MKKITLSLIFGAALMAMTSCGQMTAGQAAQTNSGTTTITDILGAVVSGGTNQGTTQSTTTTTTTEGRSDDNGSQSLLGSLLSGLIGQAMPVNAKTIAGTWTYQSPECRFTSENALAQAGGAVAGNTIESKLADIYANLGIKPGACTFVFNEDNTCSITFGGRTISGTYTVDSSTRDISIVSNTGLIKLNGQVYYSINTLTLLFDAQKLLQAVKMISAFTGKGSGTLATVSSLLNNYSGMMIGMNLTK